MKFHIAQAIDDELLFRRRRDRHGDTVGGTLRVDGRDVELELLSGEGNFARVYRAADPPRDVYSFVAPGILDKEIAEAAFSRAPANPHLPEVRRLGADPNTDENVYRMPFYRVPVPRESDAEEIRVRLDTCSEDYRGEGVPLDEATTCARRWDVDPLVVRAMELLAEEASKSDFDYRFEFPRQNVGLDEDGNIVLLDVLYPL
jgi:hypothetical protein